MAPPFAKDKTVEKIPHPSPPEESPPPTYDAGPSNLSAAFAYLDLSAVGTYPTKDRCVVHLKLLEAFHQLREDIATTDGLWGIKDSFVPPNRSDREQAAALLRIREKRWAVYVAKAASRFETWWEKSIQPGSRMLRQGEIEHGEGPRATAAPGEVLPFSPDNLPPLGEVPESNMFGVRLTRSRCDHGLAFLYAKPSRLS